VVGTSLRIWPSIWNNLRECHRKEPSLAAFVPSRCSDVVQPQLKVQPGGSGDARWTPSASSSETLHHYPSRICAPSPILVQDPCSFPHLQPRSVLLLQPRLDPLWRALGAENGLFQQISSAKLLRMEAYERRCPSFYEQSHRQSLFLHSVRSRIVWASCMCLDR
jgi:hypothetical protein